jgi:hypothetical protein
LKGNTYFGDTFTLMHYIQEEDLNDEVEIIEEKKSLNDIRESYGLPRIEEKKIPEKLKDIIKDGCIEAPDNFILMDKINEIIDYLKSKGE